MRVLDAGHRERQALLKWVGNVDDNRPNVPFQEPRYGTMLEKARYDAHLDALIIPWPPGEETVITIAEVNALEGGYGTLRGKTDL
jgi:hypothetical protein